MSKNESIAASTYTTSDFGEKYSNHEDRIRNSDFY